jgi:protoheme IX farnesyltransferase
VSANPEEITTAIPIDREVRLALDRARAFVELAKPNLSFLVVVTAALGFFLGSGGDTAWTTLFYLLLGTMLTAGGACALNMVIEADHDAAMRRTIGRPIPSGRLTAKEGTAFAFALFAWGFLDLLLFAGLWPALLSLISAATYIGAYTPLKRRGPVAIWIGAITGAIPPVMGWAAATGEIGAGGLVLFAILFTWQFPHFLALGFMYRDDYRRAGFRLVSEDPKDVGRHVAAGLVLLLASTVMLFGIDLSGMIYLIGSAIAGGFFLATGIRFAVGPTMRRARATFFASIAYLPALFALIVLDRLVD